MKLKHAILSVMDRDGLKSVVDELQFDGVDRRSREDMLGLLSRSRSATAECLLNNLSEVQVKNVCELVGADCTGRRAELIRRLLAEGQPQSSNRRDSTSIAARRSSPKTKSESLETRRRMNNDELAQEVTPNAIQPQPVRLPDPPAGMMRVTKTELVWPGKYNDDGTIKEVPRVSLPFQVIETVNEGRATREAKKATGRTLFDIYEGTEGDTFEDGWHNKLIWGDNLLVMGSLLEKFAGKIDLIYIDPPFATGADFSFVAPIGEAGLSVEKESSLIEEKAYRDTWGTGLASYLDMLSPRIRLLWDLLGDGGNLFLHIGPAVSHSVRSLCDDVFGATRFRAEIVWRRSDPHNDAVKKVGVITDRILWYGRGDSPFYNFEVEREALTDTAEAEFSLLQRPDGTVVNWKGNEGKPGRRFKLENATWKGTNSKKQFIWRGAKPSPKREWMYDHAGMEAALSRGELYLRDQSKGAARCWRRYLDENKGILLQDLWTEVGRVKGGTDYPTQKPERLLERIVRIASPEGGLVCDAFCGSGTTLVAAENTGRRWIGCDLSRWATHLARKRLLGIKNCRPFEVLNLGRYRPFQKFCDS